MASLQPSTPPGDARDPLLRSSRNLAWPGALIDRLKTLWNENRLTASQMAERLGISRNAVLGKANRLGLPTHKAKSAKPAPKPIPKAKKLPPVLPIVDEPAPPAELQFVGVSLLELGPHDCRYPQGDAVPYRFCGQPKREGSSYCPYHHALSYHPRSSRPMFIPAPWVDARRRR
jgi:GcrA cell cycle regulator